MHELSFPLTNAQIELLKLFSTNMNNEELNELRNLLAQFYANKAINEADRIWDEKNLTEEDMMQWLHKKS